MADPAERRHLPYGDPVIARSTPVATDYHMRYQQRVTAERDGPGVRGFTQPEQLPETAKAVVAICKLRYLVASLELCRNTAFAAREGSSPLHQVATPRAHS